MSQITRRFSVTATRQTQQGSESIRLGTGVEWNGENIVLELFAIPVGNWWSGVATVQPDDSDSHVGEPAISRRFDLVAGKRAESNDGKTRWIKIGSGFELAGGMIKIDFQHIPAGNWWDGKLRLFVQRPKSKETRS